MKRELIISKRAKTCAYKSLTPPTLDSLKDNGYNLNEANYYLKVFMTVFNRLSPEERKKRHIKNRGHDAGRIGSKLKTISDLKEQYGYSPEEAEVYLKAYSDSYNAISEEQRAELKRKKSQACANYKSKKQNRIVPAPPKEPPPRARRIRKAPPSVLEPHPPQKKRKVLPGPIFKELSKPENETLRLYMSSKPTESLAEKYYLSETEELLSLMDTNEVKFKL